MAYRQSAALRISIGALSVLLAGHALSANAAAPVRARDLGVPLSGETGSLNAITDVKGVEVGHKTLISGSGPRQVGVGPVRTGVTVVLPRGRASKDPVYAGWSTLNAAGEMTGTVWLDERGMLDGPIAITNTHSVGTVRDTVVGWMVKTGWTSDWHAPVVAETYDGVLNDINGFHVKSTDVVEALESARGGPVAEGNVGGGTGMICHRFKGGIGTSSRIAKHDNDSYTVGVLVQCNYGDRRSFRLAGAPAGRDLVGKYMPCQVQGDQTGLPRPMPKCQPQAEQKKVTRDGSIIVVVATDAPLLPHQLKRLSKRASLGLGRMGSVASAGSGDIFVAFSTANPQLRSDTHEVISVSTYPNEDLSPLFEAAVDATEESILNAMIAAKDMTGADDVKVFALPHDEVKAALKRYGLVRK